MLPNTVDDDARRQWVFVIGQPLGERQAKSRRLAGCAWRRNRPGGAGHAQYGGETGGYCYSLPYGFIGFIFQVRLECATCLHFTTAYNRNSSSVRTVSSTENLLLQGGALNQLREVPTYIFSTDYLILDLSECHSVKPNPGYQNRYAAMHAEMLQFSFFL